MKFPSIERRDSGPAWQDKTSDEYYAAESEVTAERGEWADSMFGVADPLDDAIEANGGRFTL